MKHEGPSNHCGHPWANAGSCQFGDKPRISLETDNARMPRVEIYTCRNCGFGVTRPAMSDVSVLYEDRRSQDFLSRDRGWVVWLKARFNVKLARRIAAYAPQATMVGDFGTGNGALAAAFGSLLSPGSEVYGLDFFNDPPASIGLARYLPFGSAKTLAGRLDLLTCFHVLEHDDDPRSMLRKLKDLLADDGVMVVEVPNVDCVWTPWFGKACDNWYAPFHRVHFSRNSLVALFRSEGLDVLEVKDICGPTFALSIANFIGVRPNNLIFALALAVRPLQWLVEKATARPSALRLIARKWSIK